MTRLLYSAGAICALLLPTTYLGAVELKQPAAVVTDMPEAVDLSYALPETWFALPPIIDIDLKPPPIEIDSPSPPIKLAAVP